LAGGVFGITRLADLAPLAAACERRLVSAEDALRDEPVVALDLVVDDLAVPDL
jgi:hypothetical protein